MGVKMDFAGACLHVDRTNPIEKAKMYDTVETGW